jgi:hypothetical protein
MLKMQINGGKISYTLEQTLVEPVVIMEWNGGLPYQPHHILRWNGPYQAGSVVCYNLTLSTYPPKSSVNFRNLLFTLGNKACPISSQVVLQQCNKEGGRKSSSKEKNLTTMIELILKC